jgi:methylamine dehydrogenase accessory protein MauD
MSSAVAVLLVAQWIAIILLGLLLLGLARQVGVLHRRIGPAGALMTSAAAKVGDLVQPFSVQTIEGGRKTVGGLNPSGKSTLIAFVAPDCPVCSRLMPVYKSLVAAEGKSIELVFASDSAVEGHEAYRKRHGIEGLPYILSTELGMRFQIGKLPYAVLLDEAGVIASQGLVNSREHLESLLEAQRSKIASIQDYYELKTNAR